MFLFLCLLNIFVRTEKRKFSLLRSSGVTASGPRRRERERERTDHFVCSAYYYYSVFAEVWVFFFFFFFFLGLRRLAVDEQLKEWAPSFPSSGFGDARTEPVWCPVPMRREPVSDSHFWRHFFLKISQLTCCVNQVLKKKIPFFFNQLRKRGTASFSD